MAEMNLKVARGFKTGTKINSISVPPELRVKKPSGIPWLDDALGGEGGFTPTVTMMLTGGPGAGKSTLLRQLADSMDRQTNCIAVYNTGEESLFQAKMACERLRTKSDFMVGEEVMLPKMLTFLDNLKSEPKNKGKQIVYLQDSLQTVDDGFYSDKDGNSRGTNSKTPTRSAQMIVDWMQRNFGIGVFIGQCTKGGEFAGQNTIKHAVDVHAHMFYDEKEKSDTYGCLIFEVQKNRWGCNGKSYILSLTKTGIEERGHFVKAGAANREPKEDEDAA